MSKLLRKHIERIVSLTEEEFRFVLTHFSSRKLKKHQFFIQEGDAAPYDCFVLKGLLKAYHINQEGKEHILQFAMEDGWISDYQAYFNQTRAKLNVDCVEDSEFLCISVENREKLCAELGKMECFFRKTSNAGYIALQGRILCFLNSNSRERYEKVLQQNPLLFQRVPKTLIASYLGVSRETLSRFSS